MNKDSQKYQLKLLYQLSREIDEKIKKKRIVKDRKEKLNKINDIYRNN